MFAPPRATAYTFPFVIHRSRSMFCAAAAPLESSRSAASIRKTAAAGNDEPGPAIQMDRTRRGREGFAMGDSS